MPPSPTLTETEPAAKECESCTLPKDRCATCPSIPVSEWREVKARYSMLLEMLEQSQRSHIEQSQQLSRMTSAIHQNTVAISQWVKVPFSFAAMGLASWFFHQGKLDQNHWSIGMCIALYPWFGDSINAFFDRFTGKKIAGDMVKIAMLGGILVALGCDRARRDGNDGRNGTDGASRYASVVVIGGVEE